VGLLTIGAFARASRLSPKALRLYDELGLLPPAHVDPVTGYRFYQPAQLDRARLVAWLRRLGMPLARIKAVCALAPTEAAGEVAAYWAQVETDAAARRDLASFLISYLSGKETALPVTQEERYAVRYAAASDIGRCREANQDAAYGSERLLAVADGCGSEGGRASAAVIEALKPLEAHMPAGDLLNALHNSVEQAATVVDGLGGEERDSATTITAILLSGSRLALVHIGDTRAYVLRDGELFLITHDHTVVQSMLDTGQLTPEEAKSHPQRSLLLRAIDGGQVTLDMSLREVAAGDRYLLCSDGLSAVVETSAIHETLASAGDPRQAVRRLIGLANAAGGPDNIACVVADIVAEPAAGPAEEPAEEPAG
jgi:PPM family protein phosphatase